MKIFLILFSVAIGLSTPLYSQELRELINDGVDHYKDNKFSDAEVKFKKGLEKAPENFVPNFNLGDAYYKQGRYDEAIKSFQSALIGTENNNFKSRVYHNIGNSLLKSQKVKESIEAYKNALKLNPNDQDTKYNLSYALSLLNNQNNQQQQNKDQQNQDQKDKNQKDQNKDQNNQKDKNKPNQDQKAQQDNLKPEKNKISKEEAERILQALKNNEKDLQKKLRKKVGVPVKTDKDW